MAPRLRLWPWPVPWSLPHHLWPGAGPLPSCLAGGKGCFTKTRINQHGTNQIHPNPTNSNQNHPSSSRTDALCQIHFALSIPFTLQNLGPSPALCFGLHLHGLINRDSTGTQRGEQGELGAVRHPIRCRLLDGGRRDDILMDKNSFFDVSGASKLRLCTADAYMHWGTPKRTFTYQSVILFSTLRWPKHISSIMIHLNHWKQRAPHTHCAGPESRSVALRCPTRELPRSLHAQ